MQNFTTLRQPLLGEKFVVVGWVVVVVVVVVCKPIVVFSFDFSQAEQFEFNQKN
jgi:hypothetical protein